MKYRKRRPHGQGRPYPCLRLPWEQWNRRTVQISSEPSRRMREARGLWSLARHLLDITMFYASESGGVKRYLSAKRDWLRRHTSVRHSLLVPAETDSDDGAATRSCASPAIRITGGYHWPRRREGF